MKPGPVGDLYRPHTKNKQGAVAFVTVGELLFGAYKRKWGKAKIEDLNYRLTKVTIVPYDNEVCVTYADIKAQLVSRGRTKADNDLWIAACAIRHSIRLLTNNRAHFDDIPGLIITSEAPVKIDPQKKLFEAPTTEPSAS